jgi:hypothetical protein
MQFCRYDLEANALTLGKTNKVLWMLLLLASTLL